MAKTALEKLNVSKQPKIVSPVPEGFPGWQENRSMVVSTPREIDSIVRRIPEGRLVTLDSIRTHLRTKYATDMACPVSTAIFINIVAAAAEEMAARGDVDIAPWWRILKNGGLLNPKFPGGADAQAARLEAEGFMVIRGKRGLTVKDYEHYLVELK